MQGLVTLMVLVLNTQMLLLLVSMGNSPLIVQQASSDLQDSQTISTAVREETFHVYSRGRHYILVYSEGPRHLRQEKTEAKACVEAGSIAVPTDLSPDFVVDRVMEQYQNGATTVLMTYYGLFRSDPTTINIQFQVLRSLQIEGSLFYEVRFVVSERESRVVIGAVDKTVWVISYTSNEEKLTPEQLKEWEAILANLRLKPDGQTDRNK